MSKMVRAVPGAQDIRQKPNLDTTTFQGSSITHIHPHSDWDDLDMLTQPLCTPGIWEETGETHTDMGRTANSLQTVTLARNCLFVFSLINVTSKDTEGNGVIWGPAPALLYRCLSSKWNALSWSEELQLSSHRPEKGGRKRKSTQTMMHGHFHNFVS